MNTTQHSRTAVATLVSPASIMRLFLALALVLTISPITQTARATTAEWAADTAWPSEPVTLSAPMGVAVAADGSVYVAEALGQRVKKISAAGVQVATWQTGVSTVPRGIALDTDGNVYVADTGKDQIIKFSPSGALLGTIGSGGTAPGQLNDPFGVTVDASGNIFVADTFNHRIQKFSPAGTLLAAWGTGAASSAVGAFNFPYDVAVDPSGNIYVIEGGSNRIQKLSSAGVSLATWGGTAMSFFSPRGITLDSAGSIYVSDTLNHRIKKVSSTGALQATWSSSGTALGQVRNPYGIALDAAGRVYVADSSNNRVQRFVLDTTAPVISGAPSDMVLEATSADGSVATFSATAEDAIDGNVPVVFEPASGSTFPVGVTRVTYSATDKAGNAATGSFTVTVNAYVPPKVEEPPVVEPPVEEPRVVEPPVVVPPVEEPPVVKTRVWGGIQQPINADGGSIFKLGSTVPVKFALGYSDGTVIADEVATISVVRVASTPGGTELEAFSSSAASTGNTFRFDSAAGQYVYNFGTKGLAEGRYEVRITLSDGRVETAGFSLRR